MRKSIILAVGLMVALVAVPASASVQNVKISGSINSLFLHRSNFNFGNVAQGDEKQNLGITQATLQVDADLTDQVMATIALINERAWEANPSEEITDVDIYLAYVTLREMLYSPLTVVIGRQVWAYGNSLVFDATGINNSAPTASGLASVAGDLTKQTSLDAVRVILDYNPLTLEGFASVVSDTYTLSTTDVDHNVYGVHANYQVGDEMDTVVETYLFAKKDKSTVGDGGKVDFIKILGFRTSTNPLEGLNIQGEFAWQSGNKVTASSVNQSRRAFAVQGIANYQVPVMEDYNPTVSYVFTKVTGDSSGGGNDHNYGAWDPFYEAQGGGKIYNTLFHLSDLIIHSASVSADPMEDVNTKVSFSKLYRVTDVRSATETLEQPDGSDATLSSQNARQKGLGYELDFDATYDYTEDVQLGLNVGAYFPGERFKEKDIAKQVLVNLNVVF